MVPIKAILRGGPLDGQEMISTALVIVHVQVVVDQPSMKAQARPAVYVAPELTADQIASARSLAFFHQHLPITFDYKPDGILPPEVPPSR